MIRSNLLSVGVPEHWYAAYTFSCQEKKVAQHLSTRGIEFFLPAHKKLSLWKNGLRMLIERPLFPCYVFIRVGLDRQLQVLGTPGIINIVGWAGHPAIIPQDEIDTVRQVLESSLLVESHPFLQCGDRVRVETGPLQGIEGILIRKKNTFRLVVSVEMLGRSAAVEIDISRVRKINPFHVIVPSSSFSAPA